MLYRTLVVANRTAQTPVLLQEIDRRAARRPTAFTLLVPGVLRRPVDWTLEEGLKAIRTAARGPAGLRPVEVDGLDGGPDPYASVTRALEHGVFDDVIISTLPAKRSKWNGSDVVTTLGLPVTVINPPAPSRDRLSRFVLPFRPDGRDG